MADETVQDSAQPKAKPGFEIDPDWDRILVRPVEFETGGKIAVFTTGVEAPDRGEILALGWDVDTERYHVGDIVLWGKYSGIPSEDDRHLVRQGDIVGHIRGATIKEKGAFDVLGRPIEAK